MNEYKRKKVRKSSVKNSNKKPSKSTNIYFDEEENDIKPKKKAKNGEYKPKKENMSDTASRKNFKVINTNKGEKPKKFFRSFLAVVLLTALILVLSFTLPGGIIEYVSGIFSSIGSGDYPVEYNGSLIIDSKQIGSCHFLLNDTTLTAFNSRGKELFKYQHGFSNPVLCVSASRALLFNEAGDTALVFSKSGLQKTVKTGSEIINGTIGRNGNFALSCVGGEYTSSVFVYSKKGKKIYTWNNAKDIVNSLCLSPNGKKVAVSCVGVSDATAHSKLYVLEYSSADPVFTKDFESNIILSMNSASRGFAAAYESGYTYFSWYKYKQNDISVKDKNLSLLRNSGGNTLLVFNRNSDKSDNRIVFVSSSGKNRGEFDFNETITDIQVKNGRIYIVSDTKVYIFGKTGSLITSGECEYGIKRFYIISNNRIAAVFDDKIERINI